MGSETFEHLPEINLNINRSGTIVTRYMERYGRFHEYKIQTTTAGYKQIQATINGKRKTFMVHRLVAMAFIEGREIKCEVNHIDGDKSNNHASNLEWCTEKENIHHAIRTGKWDPRNRFHQCKERNDEIIKEFKSGKTRKEIAEKFGMQRPNVSRIIKVYA